MPRLDSQKPLLLTQVRNNPNVRLEQLVELIHRYDDLEVEDFRGNISDILYVQLLEAGRDVNERDLWNHIEFAPKNTLEEIQNLLRMVTEYIQKYPQGPKYNDAQSLMATLQQKMMRTGPSDEDIIIGTPSSETLREYHDWVTLDRGNYNALHLYMQKYPNSVHLEELDDLMWTNSTIVISMHSLNRYLNDWPMGRHAEEARKALEELPLWEEVKRKRYLFEVADYRNNHPYSVFKSEIDMLYYELRDEEFGKMKACPTEYSEDDVERLIAADIFNLWELIDNELLPEKIQNGGELPSIGEYLIEDSNLKAPENCRDIYFLGSPDSGKTSLLMGLTGVERNDYMLNLTEYGGPYAAALQQYVHAGFIPYQKYYYYSPSIINGKMFYTRKKKGILNLLFPWKKVDIDVIAEPFNIIDSYSHDFACKIADCKGVTLADLGTGATNLLKNKNRKVFFIIVDPTRLKVEMNCCVEMKDPTGNVIRYDIRTKWISQLDILNKFVSLFELPENQEIMEKVDAIHFVVTKADTLGETDKERQRKAKELLLDIYEGPVQQLKDYCRRSKRVNYSTNYNPCVFTFSLGKFYLGNVFDYDPTDSLKIVEALHTMIRGYRCPKRDSIKDYLKSVLNK